MDQPATRPKTRVLITSYGVLHGPAPAPVTGAPPVEVDLTAALRNPHDDPGMRYRTGLDADVYEHVMSTPGATGYRDAAVREVEARVASGANPVEVFAYCRGARHRSVAMAEAIAAAIGGDVETTVTHRDINKPVIQSIPVIQEA